MLDTDCLLLPALLVKLLPPLARSWLSLTCGWQEACVLTTAALLVSCKAQTGSHVFQS